MFVFAIVRYSSGNSNIMINVQKNAFSLQAFIVSFIGDRVGWNSKLRRNVFQSAYFSTDIEDWQREV